jgi:serine/threonine-protein kinase
MEFLQGMTLKDALQASGRIPEKRALQIAHDVVSALEDAHGVGLVHRDLKPENIMLRVDKCLKVMDFGIAKVIDEVGLTTSNMFIGSPAYAAPEMIDSKTVDHRVDLYSLGMILFEMLQGFPPFTGPSPVAVLLKHRSDPLPPLAELPQSVSRGTWSLVETLTAKKPDKRLPDARSARLAIELLHRN